MISEFYQVRIEDLLSIPHAGTRWILIKKALAADARSPTTKPIEFAYRDLEGAERHLIKIADDSSEFLYLPTDLEPEDDADKMSGSPLLLTFAKKANKAPKPSRRKQEEEMQEDDEEIEVLDPVDTVSAAPSVENAEADRQETFDDLEVVAKPQDEIEEDASEVEAQEARDDAAQIPPADELPDPLEAEESEPLHETEADEAVVAEAAPEPEVETMPDFEEDRAEIVRVEHETHDDAAEIVAAPFEDLQGGQAEDNDDVVQEDEPSAPEAKDAESNGDEVSEESSLSARNELEVVVPAEASEHHEAAPVDEDGVPEGYFRADLDGLLRIDQDRARWILLKKMVAAVVGRRHVRSLGPDQLGTEENAIRLIREAGGHVDIPLGGEPGDHSDHSRRATSLEAYFTTGQWSVPTQPLPEKMDRKPRHARGAEASSTVEESSGQIDEAAVGADDATADPGDAVEVEGTRASIALPSQLPLDIAANDDWLRGVVAAGGDPVVHAEWLARSLEAEAARLRAVASAVAARS